MKGALVAATALALAAAVTGCGSGRGVGAGSPLPPSSAAATVIASPAGSARQLSSDWLGFNGEALTATPGLWRDRRFVSAVAALRPESVRLFGGTTANFWDWRRGTFVDAAAARVTGLPAELAAARPRVSVSLADLARVVRAAHATPVYDLNVVSSSLANQLAMLHAAQRLGLPVTRVELGNELYLGRYRRLFADGAAYGRLATRWTAALKAAFPGVRVAAVGFVARDTGARTNARERGWNAGVLSTLRGGDALTFHPYFTSGLSARPSLASPSAVTRMLIAPTLRFLQVQALAFSRLRPGMTAWVTEYNLFDRVAPAHTTWAQGLALAVYSLDLIADPRVDQVDVHALVASAPFGALFADHAGLGFGASASRSFHVPRRGPPAAQPFGRSATGVATAALLAALHGTSTAQPFEFPVVAPRSLAGSPATALRGELFGSAGHASGALVLNLSRLPLLVRAPAGLERGRFEQHWGSPATLVWGAGALRHASGALAGGAVVAPGYSVTVFSR